MPHIYSYPPRLDPPLFPASHIATCHRLFCSYHLLNHNYAHISLCQVIDIVTCLRNISFIALCFSKYIWFYPWQLSADVASGVIAFPFLWGVIPYLNYHKYHGTLRLLPYGLPYAIISPPSHLLFLPLLSFSNRFWPVYLPCLYPPPLSPSSQNICRPPSPSLLSSYSARLNLSVFYHYLHTCQTPRVFSSAPLCIILSGPPVTIIYLSPQNLYLPLICVTSVIIYPYPPTPDISHSSLL